MLKVRLMGTKNDIVWFQKILQRHPKIEVLEISELYSNKGTNKYYRAYAEVQKSNDARSIMLDYRNNYEFIPNKLRFIDYQIEGSYGVAPGIKWFEEYISGKHGHGVALLNRVAPIKNWTKEKKREYISIR